MIGVTTATNWVDWPLVTHYTAPSMDTRQRWRVIFGKGAPIKYISHLDLCQTWERVLRRAGVPVAYSKGFNPQPRLQLAAALPVGYTSCVEAMDVIVEQPMHGTELVSRLRPVLPVGLTVTDARLIEPNTGALQSSLRQAEYRVRLDACVSPEEIVGRINDFLGTEHFEQHRVRKQRTEKVDLRPMVDDVRLEADVDGELVVWMRVSAGPLGNVRPETVLEALRLEGGHPLVERTKLVFELDLGDRRG